MSCDLTPMLVADYLDAGLPDERRQRYDEHLAHCKHCRAELTSFQTLHQELAGWHDHAVPEWSRAAVATSAQVADVSFNRFAAIHSAEANRSTKAVPKRRNRRPAVAQWLPLAVSLLLAIAVVTQTRFSADESGWTLSFGAPAAPLPATGNSPDLADYLAQQRNAGELAAALRERLDISAQQGVSNPQTGDVRGHYLAGQGIVFEIIEPGQSGALSRFPQNLPGQTSDLSNGVVTRPDLDTVREVYALSLGADEPERSVIAQASEQQAGFESRLYAALCDFAGDIRLLADDEYVTLVMPVPGGATGQGARDRLHRLSRSDLQACQRGDINAVTLQQRAVSYSD